MPIKNQIQEYLNSLPQTKKTDVATLHVHILALHPTVKLWFFDGKNQEGKIVSNPNIGYGIVELKYTNGTTKPFYKVGISANTTGVSIYIMGIANKNYLQETYGKTIGKATVTGYCIKFKTLKDIDFEVLSNIIAEALNG